MMAFSGLSLSKNAEYTSSSYGSMREGPVRISLGGYLKSISDAWDTKSVGFEGEAKVKNISASWWGRWGGVREQ